MASGSQSNPFLRLIIAVQRTVYRLTSGRIGGRTLGVETMLLTTVGARSGKPRTTPLIYLRDGPGWAVFATDNGSDRNPAWYHNLRAHPEAEIQIGRQHFRVRATLATEEERRRLWGEGKRRVRRFPMYEVRTGRSAIPVFQLRRRDVGEVDCEEEGAGTTERQHQIEAIRALIYRYAELLDAGDIDGFATLFASGALSVAGTATAVRGSEEVRSLMSKSLRFYDGVPATRHVNTNTIVTLVPAMETAYARTYFTVFQALPDFPLQAIVVGRYLDRFRQGPDGWRFELREIAIDLVGDVSHHLATAL